MSIQGDGEDLVDLTSIADANLETLFYQIEPDLLKPGNIMVGLNETVATISPNGDIEYIYGWVGYMVRGYKSEYKSCNDSKSYLTIVTILILKL